MPYPYTRRNLFLEPEFYEYSQFDKDLIQPEWSEQRLAFAASLEAANPPQPAEKPPSPKTEGAFELRDILSGIWRGDLDEDDFQTEMGALAALVAKFEIFRRLFKTYDGKLRKLPDAEVAAPSDYVLLARILCRECADSELSYLVSTLLKLTDMLTSLPPGTYAGEDRANLRNIIRDEQKLVETWSGRVKQDATT